MVSLINKQLLLTAYAYLFIMEQQKVQQGSEALQIKGGANGCMTKPAEDPPQHHESAQKDVAKENVAKKNVVKEEDPSKKVLDVAKENVAKKNVLKEEDPSKKVLGKFDSLFKAYLVSNNGLRLFTDERKRVVGQQVQDNQAQATVNCSTCGSSWAVLSKSEEKATHALEGHKTFCEFAEGLKSSKSRKWVAQADVTPRVKAWGTHGTLQGSNDLVKNYSVKRGGKVQGTGAAIQFFKRDSVKSDRANEYDEIWRLQICSGDGGEPAVWATIFQRLIGATGNQLSFYSKNDFVLLPIPE